MSDRSTGRLSQDADLRAAGERIEALLRELAALDPAAGARGEELAALLSRLYGAGLSRIVAAIGGGPVLDRLTEDELVASLLVLHDLHPLDLAARVERALDGVRPYLGSHAGGVELLGVEGGVVRLRLQGSCDGCPSSALTMKHAIEKAIGEAAPEVSAIVVEGDERAAESAEETASAAAPHPPPHPPTNGGPVNGGDVGHGGSGKLVQIGGVHGVSARPPHHDEAADARCELCGAPIAAEHRHLVNLETRSLLCACRPCGLLFTRDGAAGGKYRAVPERYLAARDLALSEPLWESLQIPVGIAFFFQHGALGRAAAFYPGPAGATESLLPLEAWETLVRSSPLLADLEPDVEALLVHKHGAGFFESYVVPIDACYELTGRIRRTWKGFSGGEEAWREIEGFFAGVRKHCGAPRQEMPASLEPDTAPDPASVPCPT